MPWIIPASWSVGNVPTATDFNRIEGNLTYLREEAKIINGTTRFTDKVSINTTLTERELNIQGSAFWQHSGIWTTIKEGALNTQCYLDLRANNNVVLMSHGKYESNSNAMHLDSAVDALKLNHINNQDIEMGGSITATGASVEFLKDIDPKYTYTATSKAIGTFVTEIIAQWADGNIHGTTGYFNAGGGVSGYISGINLAPTSLEIFYLNGSTGVGNKVTYTTSSTGTIDISLRALALDA